MIDVVDFFFNTCLSALWSTITSQWILSSFVLITILTWIAGIYVSSREK